MLRWMWYLRIFLGKKPSNNPPTDSNEWKITGTHVLERIYWSSCRVYMLSHLCSVSNKEMDGFYGLEDFHGDFKPVFLNWNYESQSWWLFLCSYQKLVLKRFRYRYVIIFHVTCDINFPIGAMQFFTLHVTLKVFMVHSCHQGRYM